MFLWKGQTDLFRALFIFPVGFATGVAHSATFIGLSQGVDSEDIAIAGSGLYLSSNIGMVAGVSVGNAVYQLGLSRGLESALQELPNRETVRGPSNPRRHFASLLSMLTTATGYPKDLGRSLLCARADWHTSKSGPSCLRAQL